jgi:hypothetical protein
MPMAEMGFLIGGTDPALPLPAASPLGDALNPVAAGRALWVGATGRAAGSAVTPNMT